MKFHLPRSIGSRLYLGQLAVVAAGLLLVAMDHWRIGVATVGAAFCVGAALRLVIPVRDAGMLRVRGRWFDISWTLLLGTALIALAIAVPVQPGA